VAVGFSKFGTYAAARVWDEIRVFETPEVERTAAQGVDDRAELLQCIEKTRCLSVLLLRNDVRDDGAVGGERAVVADLDHEVGRDQGGDRARAGQESETEQVDERPDGNPWPAAPEARSGSIAQIADEDRNDHRERSPRGAGFGDDERALARVARRARNGEDLQDDCVERSPVDTVATELEGVDREQPPIRDLAPGLNRLSGLRRYRRRHGGKATVNRVSLG